MKKNNKKGFTLAELLIVVAIIAVLVAISIPVFTAQLHKSQDTTEIANARSLFAELQADYLGNYTDTYAGKCVGANQASITTPGGQTITFKNGTCTVAFEKDKGYTVTWNADSGCPSGNTNQVWGYTGTTTTGGGD